MALTLLKARPSKVDTLVGPTKTLLATLLHGVAPLTIPPPY